MCPVGLMKAFHPEGEVRRQKRREAGTIFKYFRQSPVPPWKK